MLTEWNIWWPDSASVWNELKIRVTSMYKRRGEAKSERKEALKYIRKEKWKKRRTKNWGTCALPLCESFDGANFRPLRYLWAMILSWSFEHETHNFRPGFRTHREKINTNSIIYEYNYWYFINTMFTKTSIFRLVSNASLNFLLTS